MFRADFAWFCYCSAGTGLTESPALVDYGVSPSWDHGCSHPLPNKLLNSSNKAPQSKIGGTAAQHGLNLGEVFFVFWLRQRSSGERASPRHAEAEACEGFCPLAVGFKLRNASSNRNCGPGIPAGQRPRGCTSGRCASISLSGSRPSEFPETPGCRPTRRTIPGLSRNHTHSGVSSVARNDGRCVPHAIKEGKKIDGGVVSRNRVEGHGMYGNGLVDLTNSE